MPKISIIIAVYNVEKYLRECLDSIINQTFKDIEIICVNDGSTDNCLEIIKEYQTKDQRIIIINQNNLGLGLARANAMKKACGKYIMIVDSDDILELNACELAYNQIEQNGNELVIFDYTTYNEDLTKIIDNKNHLIIFKDVIKNPHIKLSKIKKNFFQSAYAWKQIYNRQFLIDNEIEFQNFRFCEDTPFVFISYILSDDISILNKSLYKYRVRKSSLSFSANNWQDAIESRKYVATYIINKNLINPYLYYYTEQSCHILQFWYRRITSTDSSIKKTFKKEIIRYMDSLKKYQNIKTAFECFTYKYSLNWIYYKIRFLIAIFCNIFPIKIEYMLHKKK